MTQFLLDEWNKLLVTMTGIGIKTGIGIGIGTMGGIATPAEASGAVEGKGGLGEEAIDLSPLFLML